MNTTTDTTTIDAPPAIAPVGKPARGRRGPIPAELPAESVVAIRDTREQHPLCLDPLSVVIDTLATGDYSVRGLESIVAIERKSLPDLLGCIGGERERFDREVMRLLAYPVRCLVVETDWRTLEAGDFGRSQITAAQAVDSVLGWQASGLPVLFVGNHEAAGRAVARLLYLAARRRWRENRALLADVLEENDQSQTFTMEK